MASRQKLIHIHSKVYNEGIAKAPQSEQLEYGELAVNYNATQPSLFLRDADDNIRQFSSDDVILDKAILGEGYVVPEEYGDENEMTITSGDTVTSSIGKLVRIIEDDEEIIAASLNDLNERVNALNDVNGTLTENIEGFETLINDINGNINTLSGNVETINTRIDEIINLPSTVISDEYVGHEYNELLVDAQIIFETISQGDNMDIVADKLEGNLVTLVDKIIDDEKVISSSLNDLNDRIENVTTYVNEFSTEANERIDNISGDLNTLSGSVETAIADVNTRIDNIPPTVISEEYVEHEYSDKLSEVSFETITKGDTFDIVADKLETNLVSVVNVLSDINVSIDDDYVSVNYPILKNNDFQFTPIVAEDNFTTVATKVDTNLSFLATEIVQNELVVSHALNTLRIDIDNLTNESNYTNGTFINISDENVIDVITGVTSDSIAVGNHNHDEVYAKIEHTHDEFNILQENIDNLQNELIDNEFVISEALNVLDERTKVLEYQNGHNEVTTSLLIPVTKRLVICKLTHDDTLSLIENLEDGKEMQIMVNNESDSTITLTLPLTGCINFNGNSITLTSGAWAKINIISDGTNLFLSHSVFGTGNGW